jgi:hypothetical protein
MRRMLFACGVSRVCSSCTHSCVPLSNAELTSFTSTWSSVHGALQPRVCVSQACVTILPNEGMQQKMTECTKDESGVNAPS